MRRASPTTKKPKSRHPSPSPAEHVNPLLISAIHDRDVLSFDYEGEGPPRIVEPQTYGRGANRGKLLRARERDGIAKLFAEKKVSGLKKTGARFEKALPEHNPDDSAMVEIFATL